MSGPEGSSTKQFVLGAAGWPGSSNAFARHFFYSPAYTLEMKNGEAAMDNFKSIFREYDIRGSSDKTDVGFGPVRG